jgi:hypothetical protein
VLSLLCMQSRMCSAILHGSRTGKAEHRRI